jgi:hypothetical protein
LLIPIRCRAASASAAYAAQSNSQQANPTIGEQFM